MMLVIIACILNLVSLLGAAFRSDGLYLKVKLLYIIIVMHT